MDNYGDYYIEDFVLDASFQRWVRFEDEESSRFWETFQKDHLEKTGDIDAARILLQGVYLPREVLASDDEIQTEISKLIVKIQANRLAQSNQAEQELPRITKLPYMKWWLSAASVAVICTLAFWYGSPKNQSLSEVLKSERGRLTETVNDGPTDKLVALEDGSSVLLRPGTTVRYAEHFGVDHRALYLSGEALFKVAKDADRPFLVFANELVTRVLGTTFIVRSFEGEKESSVEVMEGKVSVYKRKDFGLPGNGSQAISKGIVLNANQKILFQLENGTMTKSLIDAPQMVQSGKVSPTFVYRNTSVAEVLTDIERAYQLDIVFDAELLKDCPVTAVLSNQSLMEKIEIICETVEAKFEVIDGQIIVYGSKCSE